MQTKLDIIKENDSLKREVKKLLELFYLAEKTIEAKEETVKLKDITISLLEELHPERKHALLFPEKNGQCRVLKMSHS